MKGVVFKVKYIFFLILEWVGKGGFYKNFFLIIFLILQKSSRDIIKKSLRNHVTKYQNVITEEKRNVQWKGTIKLMT